MVGCRAVDHPLLLITKFQPNTESRWSYNVLKIPEIHGKKQLGVKYEIFRWARPSARRCRNVQEEIYTNASSGNDHVVNLQR
jgi:hypothetical protein